jgi:Tat protein secretion system quality control protein TatD with DNase activity
VDSHCHIVFRNFDEDLDEVAQRWRDAGVKALVHACVEPAEIPAIRALADRFAELRYSVGVHPLDTQHWRHDTQQLLRQAASGDVIESDAEGVNVGTVIHRFRRHELFWCHVRKRSCNVCRPSTRCPC